MQYSVISCSLNPQSRSALLAQNAFEQFEPESADWIDLREYALPFCDAGSAFESPVVQDLTQRVAASDGILLASPIYNYSLNAAAKNLLELTGKSWMGKTVGFLCAAGGQGSYMAPMHFIEPIMLDYRCMIIPRFVYATGASFEGARLNDPELEQRITQVVQALQVYTKHHKAAQSELNAGT